MGLEVDEASRGSSTLTVHIQAQWVSASGTRTCAASYRRRHSGDHATARMLPALHSTAACASCVHLREHSWVPPQVGIQEPRQRQLNVKMNGLRFCLPKWLMDSALAGVTTFPCTCPATLHVDGRQHAAGGPLEAVLSRRRVSGSRHEHYLEGLGDTLAGCGKPHLVRRSAAVLQRAVCTALQRAVAERPSGRACKRPAPRPGARVCAQQGPE